MAVRVAAQRATLRSGNRRTPPSTDESGIRVFDLSPEATALAEVGAVAPTGAGVPIRVVGTTGAAQSAVTWAVPDGSLAPALKRLLDVVVASLGLLLLVPLLAIVALLVLLDDGPPILFTQERVGLRGRKFKFRKFRTMVNGAEGRLGEVMGLNQIRGPGFQLDRDPRVTRVGPFLRRSSLDELPQLWNVLLGEMSLVGPRPAPMCEVDAYEPWHRFRLAVKPGMTGLAQVQARRYLDFDVKATLDLQYIERWSLWLDLEILVRTVPFLWKWTGR